MCTFNSKAIVNQILSKSPSVNIIMDITDKY